MISRRKLLRQIGASAAGTAALPSLLRAAGRPVGVEATPDGVARRGPLRLHRNENAYGPSPNVARVLRETSIEATTRYPDALEQRLRARLADLHRVTPGRVVLGCGSGEILRMAAAAFLGPHRKIILARPTFELMEQCARGAVPMSWLCHSATITRTTSRPCSRTPMPRPASFTCAIRTIRPAA